jgi:thiamine biosynthesis protein ThiI
MKACALMSDGIDSPVATYLMAKKGVNITVVHANNSPKDDLGKVMRLVRAIAKASGNGLELVTFDHYPNQEAFLTTKPKWFHCLLCKRMMVRVASELATRRGGEFIIMGDSLGQVASQTLPNIRIVEEASSLPVIRPLIGLDKLEIERIGIPMGSFEISIRDQAKCQYVPEKASVKGHFTKVHQLESLVDIKALVEKSLDSVKEIPVQS